MTSVTPGFSFGELSLEPLELEEENVTSRASVTSQPTFKVERRKHAERRTHGDRRDSIRLEMDRRVNDDRREWHSWGKNNNL